MNNENRILALQCIALGVAGTLGKVQPAHADAHFGVGFQYSGWNAIGSCVGMTDGVFDWWTMDRIGVDCGIVGPGGSGYAPVTAYDVVTAFHWASAYNSAYYSPAECDPYAYDTVTAYGVVDLDNGGHTYHESSLDFSCGFIC